MSGVRLLVADDNREFCDLFRVAVGQSEPSWVVEIACDGREALEMLCKGYYDVAVLDYAMPHLDGLEVLREAREKGIRTVVLILTGFDDPKMGFRVGQSGASDFLQKPILMTQLIAAVRKALEAKFPFHIRAEQLDDYLKAHASEPSMTVGSLCRYFDISPAYVSRLFRVHLEDTFKGRLRYYRVEMAKRLLESTSYSIKRIAWDCGYKDRHRLAEAFGRLVGMSPKAYRKICSDKRPE